MYHAQDRLIDVPRSRRRTGKRGGIHNSLTRLLVKPSHLIGGYAQLSFAFNYLGPTGNQRDEVTIIRRRSQEVAVLTMKVMAQMAMVMNLDKCIGCHTCSVTCKQAWTNRAGTEYVWFNNVETRPGLGYPRTYEDQEKWKGGWVRNKRGRLTLQAGGRFTKLLTIFSNPKLPSIDDYYEPWTYDYETLTNAPAQEHFPVARPKSLITGKTDEGRRGRRTGTTTSAAPRSTRKRRPDAARSIADEGEVRVRADLHVLPAADLRALPEPVVRGVVPDRARSTSAPRTASCWSTRTAAAAGGCASPAARTRRSTSTTAPARPRSARSATRASRSACPTVCSETCVGRLRYIGLVLYDADQVLEAASVEDDTGPLRGPARRSSSTRTTRRCIARPSARASPSDWIEAAQRSPVYALINTYQVALPLHPEYRTMPMVWYIPPLSPVVDVVRDTGHDAEDQGNLFARDRRAADPGRVPGRAVHRRRRRPGRRRCCDEAGRDALVHARHQPRPRARRVDPGQRSA